ncbi:hypothetical protein VTK73DRAFT_2347 [Phialemonium thermophilum]|uniref:Uncharacterized protein n=1 Tax=Phialemonium thermophilum TaxID=223376 RepID=A0ABR3VS91_9PEZI
MLLSWFSHALVDKEMGGKTRALRLCVSSSAPEGRQQPMRRRANEHDSAESSPRLKETRLRYGAGPYKMT